MFKLDKTIKVKCSDEILSDRLLLHQWFWSFAFTTNSDAVCQHFLKEYQFLFMLGYQSFISTPFKPCCMRLFNIISNWKKML